MIYDYQCKNGHRFEIVCPLAEFQSERICDCGEKANIVIHAVRGITKQDVCYDCPITGIPITSYAQHRDNLARHGCQEYDPEMKTDAANFRKEQDAALDRSIEDTVVREVESMSGDKRERLGKELESSAIEYSRGNENG